jgi:tRNA1Val (adenine37-N6)-methyltransferase
MSNNIFRFKQFTIHQEHCAMKVGTDGVLLGAWTNIKNCVNILDVGTGSGIIAIMMAQRSNANIHAVEIDVESSIQATENFDICPWHQRLKAVNSSLQDYSLQSKIQYDLIVSNPPYFKNSLKSRERLRNTARHTDTLSYETLIESSIKLLTPNGRLAVILPYVEGSLFIVEATKRGLFCIRKTNVKSIPNTPIIRLLMEFSQKPMPFNEDFLVIGTGKHEQYSEKYKELTKDFYLNF